MKTGTPPRVDGRTLDYSVMEVQHGDAEPGKFSYRDETHPLKEQRPCHITYTSDEVHDVLKTGFDRSPMFNGRIQGLGPRYCPSIEDKINRFADKNRHQIFVEPEGWNTVEVYVNGFSTSLPEDVQYKAIRKIKGFEEAKMFRPGYAIEYDFFPPTQLHLTLETKLIQNLYFAGQINGTTGYEEAGCQGLMAGINAHRKVHEQDEVILSRADAYIGVLIDDLVNKGTDEPYRMFTSRAEYRILLRQDNADLRLTKIGHEIGLASETMLEKTKQKANHINTLLNNVTQHKIEPSEINTTLEKLGTSTLKEKGTLVQILKRPQVDFEQLCNELPSLEKYKTQFSKEIREASMIQLKYSDYIEKEKQLAEKMKALEDQRIADDFDYSALTSLSMEARLKLSDRKPKTLGQASRISGVSPSDVSILMVYMGR
jgi:tRNA uridine 5-carboxymethylaminomethyl modification enzyme